MAEVSPEEVCSATEKTENESVIPERQPQVDVKIDSLLLSSLQTELKYQVYSLWRQLNLIETAEDVPEGVIDNQNSISHDEYNEKVADDKPVSLKCCIRCFAHVPDASLQKHHQHRFKFDGDMKNYHYVSVLEMDHSLYAKRKVSSEIVKKVYSFEFTLYCRLCLGPVHKCSETNQSSFCPLGASFYFSLDKHLQSPRHTLAVKQYFQKPENADSDLPEFFQLLQGPFVSSDSVETPHPTNVYDPHVFLMSCCCRMAVCKYCETPPYIFESFIPPNAKFITCTLCNMSFLTTFNSHLQDIQFHVKSLKHCAKRRNLYAEQGYIPCDTSIFKPKFS